jgi:hypothetical protein
VIAGATAVGGGDFTVVVESDFDSVKLLDVESVTIGSANDADQAVTIAIATKIFFIIVPCGYCNFKKTQKTHKVHQVYLTGI